MNSLELRKILEKLENYENLPLKQIREFEKELSESDLFRTKGLYDSIANRTYKHFWIQGADDNSTRCFSFCSLDRRNFNGSVVEFQLCRPVHQIVYDIVKKEEKSFSEMLEKIKSASRNLKLTILGQQEVFATYFFFPTKDKIMVFDEYSEEMDTYFKENFHIILKDILSEYEDYRDITSIKLEEL